MKNNSIYALTVQSKEIIQALSENEGELTPQLEDMISNHEIALAHKTDAIVFCMKDIENQIEFFKQQEKQIKEYRAVLERGLERFEDRIKTFVKTIEKEKLDGDLYSISLRKSTGKVIVNDLDAIPEEYKVTKVVVDADKKKLKETLSLGIDIPGAVIEYEPTLKLSVKN